MLVSHHYLNPRGNCQVVICIRSSSGFWECIFKKNKEKRKILFSSWSMTPTLKISWLIHTSYIQEIITEWSHILFLISGWLLGNQRWLRHRLGSQRDPNAVSLCFLFFRWHRSYAIRSNGELSGIHIIIKCNWARWFSKISYDQR